MPRLTPCHADVRHLTLHIGVTIHNIIWLDTVWGRALRLRLAVATEGATARETLRYPYSTMWALWKVARLCPPTGKAARSCVL